MPDKEVSVIIPSYQSAHLLPACLKALLRNPGIKEVIVVDDASTDNTHEAISHFPVRVIRNETNQGPVASRNRGAQKASGKYLLFLDSDIEVSPQYIATLRSFMETHPLVGITSGKISNMDGSRVGYNLSYSFVIIRSLIGHYIFLKTSHLWQRGKLAPLLKKIAGIFTMHFHPDQEMRVGYVIEQAFMTTRSLFEKLDGLDKNIFMYHEGPDYCERARTMGFETWYVPSAQALHRDLQSHAETRTALRRKSTYYYFRKHGLRWW